MRVADDLYHAIRNGNRTAVTGVIPWGHGDRAFPARLPSYNFWTPGRLLPCATSCRWPDLLAWPGVSLGPITIQQTVECLMSAKLDSPYINDNDTFVPHVHRFMF